MAGGARAQTQRSADRRAMGRDRTASSASASLTERGAAAREQPRRGRRDPLGPQDGRAVARSARRIPERIDLLAAAAPMGRGGHLVGDVAGLPRPAQRARATRLGDGLHRRLVCPGEKGGSDVGKTKRGKGSKWMVVVDGQGIPLGIHVTSAAPSEMTLVDATLRTIAVPQPRGGRRRRYPDCLIGDLGYDGNVVRDALARQGITPIIPYRKGRVNRPYEDWRRLRRYRRRWIIERTFAWLGHFRRLVVRYERLTSIYCAFFYFAAALIALRRF
jgi:transposase